MAIDPVQDSPIRIGPRRDLLETPGVRNSPSPDFSAMLKSFVGDVNAAQLNAGDAVQRLASGETTEIHDVMIAVEKAGVSFELMMELRNKLLEAYQEIMRTQM